MLEPTTPIFGWVAQTLIETGSTKVRFSAVKEVARLSRLTTYYNFKINM